MKIVVRVTLCLALFLAASASFAQSDDGGGVFNMEGISDGCGSTMNADQCMWGDGSDTSGGNYYYCSAKGSWGQSCQASITDNDSHMVYCQPVSRSAKCYCDPVTFKTSGNCGWIK